MYAVWITSEDKYKWKVSELGFEWRCFETGLYYKVVYFDQHLIRGIYPCELCSKERQRKTGKRLLKYCGTMI